MSSTDTRWRLEVAREIAFQLVDVLMPACERIVVAGSIRRRVDEIGDIDLILEPKIERLPVGLFGDEFAERDLLHGLACRLADDGILEKRRDKNGRPSWGPHLKRARFHGLSVDLQAVTDPTTWGAWLLIRTGPAAFTQAVVTPRHQGGLLPPGHEWKSGFQLWRYGGRIETPTEHDVFVALGIPWRDPEERV